jgi:hypothetical protein
MTIVNITSPQALALIMVGLAALLASVGLVVWRVRSRPRRRRVKVTYYTG